MSETTLFNMETHPRLASRGLGSAAPESKGFARAGRACKALQWRDCYKGEGDRVSGGGVIYLFRFLKSGVACSHRLPRLLS